MSELLNTELKNYSTMSVKCLNYYKNIVGIGGYSSDEDENENKNENPKVNFLIGNKDGNQAFTYMTAKHFETENNPNNTEVCFNGLVKSDKIDIGIGGAHIIGDIYCDETVFATSLSTTSDKSKKNNIKKCKNAVESLSKINGVTWNWKNNNKKSSGIIANDLKKIKEFEYMVNGTPGNYSVNYNNFHGYYIEVIKELKLEIENLKKKYINK